MSQSFRVDKDPCHGGGSCLFAPRKFSMSFNHQSLRKWAENSKIFAEFPPEFSLSISWLHFLAVPEIFDHFRSLQKHGSPEIYPESCHFKPIVVISCMNGSRRILPPLFRPFREHTKWECCSAQETPSSRSHIRTHRIRV